MITDSTFTPRLKPVVQSRLGTAYVATKADLIDANLWERSFSHLCFDQRHFQTIERTIRQDFDYRYLILEDSHKSVRAIQPMFLIDQDIMAGLPRPVKAVMNAVRRFFPNFLKLKTLMVGATVGEGHLGAVSESDRTWLGEALHEMIGDYARQCDASMIVLKDFHSNYREHLKPFSNNGYSRVPSLPAVKLDLNFPSFEDYMTSHLSKATRKSLRRKFKKAAASEPIEMEVLSDVSHLIDEIYPLYDAVFQRAEFRFEKITKEYLREIGQQMPERVRFFIWRRAGKIVAFDLCFLHGDVLNDCILGLDYSIALDLHLYFITWRDIVQWAIDNNIKRYYSGPLNYDSKRHFRCDLVPLDLYVFHTSRWINPAFRRLVKWLEPTRHDPNIRLFKNAHEL
jgi:predicted N-acyltransferase